MDDYFNYSLWMECFEECGIEPSFYNHRKRSFDEILPWDHMDYGIEKEFLIEECERLTPRRYPELPGKMLPLRGCLLERGAVR